MKYLRLAASIAERSDTGHPAFPYVVSRVTLGDTAAALGVARTTLYKLWPSKLDFWSDLTTYIVSLDLGPSLDEAASFIVGDEPGVDSVMEHTRVALNGIQASLLHDPWVRLRTALLGYPDNPRVSPYVSEAAERAVRAITLQIDKMFGLAGVVPLDPLTTRDIAIATYCIADGLATAGQLVPRLNSPDIVLGGDRERPWGLLAYGALCMAMRCTRPRAAADPPPTSGEEPVQAPADLAAWNGPQLAALRAGAKLFLDGLVGSDDVGSASESTVGPLGHVTLARVARAGGVSRQALHRIWPSQAELQIDLMRYLHQQEHRDVIGVLRRAMRDGVAAGATGALVTTENVLERFTRASAAPMTHLAYASHYSEPRLREVGRVELEHTLQQYADDLEAATVSTGWAVRDELTYFHLASLVLLTEVAAGRLHRSNPGMLRRDLPRRNGHWSALTILVEAMMSASVVKRST